MISYFYPETLRSVTVSLLERFSHVQVHRFNKERTSVVKVIDVPLTFAPVEKAQQDRTEDYTVEPESLGQRYYMQIPRLALNLNGIAYAPDRATGVNDYRYFQDNTGDQQVINNMFRDYQPTPYNLTYTLFIRTDSMSDFSQIIENIIPYFNPKLYLRVKEFSFLNLERDYSVILNDVSPTFTDELDKHSKRQIDGTITFTVEAWMYRPLDTAKLVKVIKTSYFVGEGQAIDAKFNLSGFPATSAGDPPPDAPTAGEFILSAYDPDTGIYGYMDAVSPTDNVTITPDVITIEPSVIQPARVYIH